MSFRFFVVPIHDSGDGEAQLNAFLNSHRVLSVDRRWVEQGTQSFWSFCVDFLPSGQGRNPGSNGNSSQQRQSVDYKQLLPPEQFAVFAKLRELRKEIAQAEAVPVYTVFTNEQLAKMVTDRIASKAELEKIEGVGDARVGKYGDRFVAAMRQLASPAHEANGPTD